MVEQKRQRKSVKRAAGASAEAAEAAEATYEVYIAGTWQKVRTGRELRGGELHYAVDAFVGPFGIAAEGKWRKVK